jgi:hypothetical protein
MADAECGKSMRDWGWFAYKKGDAMYCPHCGKLVLPGAASGTWDFPKVGVPAWSKRESIFIDVEVKAGNTSIPFGDLRDNQRQWAEDNPEREKWLWFCIGKNRVNSTHHARRTWLFPYNVFLEWEQQLERKSLPYCYEPMMVYVLEWVGDGIWTVPERHPIYSYLR